LKEFGQVIVRDHLWDLSDRINDWDSPIFIRSSEFKSDLYRSHTYILSNSKR
jgi:hypothetical protein